MPANLSDPQAKFCLGTYIKYARRALFLTQEELSKKAGITQAFLSRIEQGNQEPSFDTLKALAEAMSCDLIIEFKLRNE